MKLVKRYSPMPEATDIIIDRVQIIGTRRTVWKAWKKCELPAIGWPYGYNYHTITHFNGVAYGRMGTERFDCPEGRSRWARLIDHKVQTKRAAHFAILKGMTDAERALPVTFDDNGTIEVSP